MEPLLYETIRKLESENWWFVGMRDIARVLMRELPMVRRAVDIGCGSGGNLTLLSEMAREVIALDLSPTALKLTRERLAAHQRVTGLVGADAAALPLATGSVDLAWLFNVLEHLPDDEACLAEMHRVLRKGGFAVVATSASMRLWSDHDVANHHQRRYRKAELTEKLQRAGFRIRRLTGANLALYAPTLAVATLHRARAKLLGRPEYRKNAVDVSPLLDKLFGALLHAETLVLPNHDLPFGVSLFAVVEKA